MLIKQTNLMSLGSSMVKNFNRATLSSVAIAAMSVAAAGSANAAVLTDKVVSVKFNLSDLSTTEGTKVVYNLLSDKAEAFCLEDKNTLNYLGETVAECKSDLLEQFIDNLGKKELTALHVKSKG